MKRKNYPKAWQKYIAKWPYLLHWTVIEGNILFMQILDLKNKKVLNEVRKKLDWENWKGWSEIECNFRSAIADAGRELLDTKKVDQKIVNHILFDRK